MRGSLGEAKVVSGPADLQNRSDGETLEDVARASPAARIALDAHDIPVVFALEVGERILPDEPVGQVEVDMRASFEGYDGLCPDRAEFKQVGLLGRIGNGCK